MKILRIFLFMWVLTIPAMLHAEAPATGTAEQALPEVRTYTELRQAISQVRVQSRERVEKAVEQERVREAWEIGRLIDVHVLQQKERADYGKQVLKRLAIDLSMSRTELSYMLQFARAYPILPHAETLSWSAYRELLSVNDAQKRQALAEQAAKEGWNRDRLRAEIRNVTKGGNAVPEELLTAQPGKPGTYKMVKATEGPETGKVVIDLGFSNYYKTSKDLSFKAGDIIEVLSLVPGKGSSPSDKIRLSHRTQEDLYTYRAWVVDVLDGDTLKVVVDLGFGVRSEQTLRLRGIDCPELLTRDGKEAKEFVQSIIARPGGSKQSILIKTVKSDKYDRYLADVFIDNRPKTIDNSKNIDWIYLNNELLDKEHAVRLGE